ncbi:MAG TPA: MFS transporter [Mycobacteriales bacterium]|jgi:MFS family permease|nr:MFS transporter [Mycobacteriales bacterium]
MTSPRGLAGTLTVTMGISTFMQYALGALGPFIADDLDISRARLGLLTTLLFAVGAALSPAGGPLVDRLGGRRSLTALCVVSGTSALLSAAAPTYLLLGLAVALAGIGLALGNLGTNKLLAQHVAPARQGVVSGIKQSGVQVGALVAGALLPAVAAAAGWRTAMALSAAVALGGLVAVITFVPRHAAEPRASRPDKATTRLGPSVNRLALYALLMGVGAGAASAHLPLYAAERLGLAKSVAGLVASEIGLTGIIGRLLLGRVADRTRTPVTVLLGWLAVAAIVATAMLLLADAHSVWLLWTGGAAFGASAIAWNGVGMLSVIRAVDPTMAGRASGRVLLGFFTGFVISPVAFGWSVDVTGSYTPGWLAVCVSFALAAVVAATWHRTLQAT